MDITVVTPTFNREKKLRDLYDSLKSQSMQDFVWLVVDDGSTDQTESFINSLFFDNYKFKINYVKKVNGGKHTALNYALSNIETKYCVIVDSDDILKSHALEFYFKKWSIADNDIVAISCLTETLQSQVIGDKFHKDGDAITHIEEVYKMNVRGDKLDCYKTDILRQYMFPVFEGERFLTEGVVWNRIGLKYKKQCFNESVMIHEYYKDGLTNNIDTLHNKSPLGSFIYHYEISNINDIPFKIRFKNRCIAFKYIFNIVFKQLLVNVFALPLGLVIYIRNTLK